MKYTRRAILVVMIVLVSGSASLATIKWGKVFNSLYSPVTDSALRKAKCAACHVKTNGKGGLNAYGKQLDGKSANQESLKSIESKDADGDGASNIVEIKAGTLPGDPKSKP